MSELTFGDRRLEKGGPSCTAGWWRLAAAAFGCAGSAATRTLARAAGRHVLAIQDTTTLRAAAEGRCVALHPVVAVDAVEGALLGLLDARFFLREGGKRAGRKRRPFAEKESRRWLDGAQRAAALAQAGAAQVTVVADCEGDVYEVFAGRPQGVELLIRAGQDRNLADGSRLFARAATLAEAGRLTVELPAAPGRPARAATLALRVCAVEIARPASRGSGGAAADLPPSLELTLVEARELNPPDGAEAAHWRLLTTHAAADAAGCDSMVASVNSR